MRRGVKDFGGREPGLAVVWGVQSWGSAKGFPLEVRGFTGSCAGWKWAPSASVGALLLWAKLRNSSKVQLCCEEVNCSVCVYSGTNCPRLRKRKALLGHNKYFLHLWFAGRSLVQMRHISKGPALPDFSDVKSSKSGNNLENKQMKRSIRRGHNIA